MKERFPERWKELPGYAGRYQASTRGAVRRANGDGTYLMLQPFLRKTGKNRRALKVWLVGPDGKRHEKSVLGIVAAAWCPPPTGYVAVHRNGIFTENGLDNIRLIPRRELTMLYPRNANRRVVCKVGNDGDVIDCYASATEAARQNYINLTTLCNHCNGKVHNPRTTDGYTFHWEE